MKDLKDKMENAKDKIVGEIKETTGKISGNEQLELKGKIQSSKADFEKKIDIKHTVNDVKENLAGKVNDMMDHKKKK